MKAKICSVVQGSSFNIPLASDSVHCAVTSPPYFGLRDYGVTGQIGSEVTPEEYVANILSISMEVRRVLRVDGTYWLNLGDSYWNNNGYQRATDGWFREGRSGASANERRNMKHDYLKTKDLVGSPWLVAFALQREGWWLRSVIVWEKPNAMPSSNTDKPTLSHEYIFVLSKSGRYFYDQYGYREASTQSSKDRYRYSFGGKKSVEIAASTNRTYIVGDRDFSETRNARTIWRFPTSSFKGAHYAVFPVELPRRCISLGTSERGVCPDCGTPWKRDRRKIGEFQRRWSENNQDGSPYNTQDSFQNVYDVSAWCPSCGCYGEPVVTEGACLECDGSGMEMEYITEQARKEDAKKTGRKDGHVSGPGGTNYKVQTGDVCPNCNGSGVDIVETWPEESIDWPTSPAIVLDPFCGSGTTLMAARDMGRSGVGIELKAEYCTIARKRLVLDKLDEWENGKKVDTSLDGLPLFGNL